MSSAKKLDTIVGLQSISRVSDRKHCPTRQCRATLRDFCHDQRGTDTIEYVALMALVAVLLFPVLRPIFDGLQSKLQTFMEAL